MTDAEHLRAAGRSPALPFSIALADGRVVQMRRILRLLPGKRIAGEATLEGRQVFVKLFIASAGERHWLAEHRGLQALRDAAVPTPDVLVSGRLSEGGFAIVSEFIGASESLASAWDQAVAASDEARAGALLSPALGLLAYMHAAGLSQRDLHLGNFLLCGSTLMVIDGDSVIAASAPLNAVAAAGNLGMLLAQLPAAWDDEIPAFLACYRSAGGGAGIEDSMLRAAIDRVRAWRVQDVLRKSLRDCTLFAVSQSARRFTSLLRSEVGRLSPLVRAPDEALASGIRLKSGNTCTVARVPAPAGGDLVIKRYNLKGVGHALSRLWRPSRAWHAWREAHRLSVYGIATPRPLALVEERFGPLRRRAWLLADHCPGPNLAEHLDPASLPPAAEAAALSRLFALLCRLRITHGDMKATNLLWHAGRVWLIDLDACTQHRSDAAWRRAWQRDRSRLLRNWPEGSVLRRWFDDALPKV